MEKWYLIKQSLQLTAKKTLVTLKFVWCLREIVLAMFLCELMGNFVCIFCLFFFSCFVLLLLFFFYAWYCFVFIVINIVSFILFLVFYIRIAFFVLFCYNCVCARACSISHKLHNYLNDIDIFYFNEMINLHVYVILLVGYIY